MHVNTSMSHVSIRPCMRDRSSSMQQFSKRWWKVNLKSEVVLTYARCLYPSATYIQMSHKCLYTHLYLHVLSCIHVVVCVALRIVFMTMDASGICHQTTFFSHTISISLPVTLSSHLHIHSDPQLFVYFWDGLIRGQMCRLCLAAAEACGVVEAVEWRGEGVLICLPVGCNQTVGSTCREGGGHSW